MISPGRSGSVALLILSSPPLPSSPAAPSPWLRCCPLPLAAALSRACRSLPPCRPSRRFHAYLVCANYTTIEFLEKRGCSPPPDHVNRYDVGVWNNITGVMGNSPLVWLLPTRWLCDGDGLAFKLNPAWFPTSKIK